MHFSTEVGKRNTYERNLFRDSERWNLFINLIENLQLTFAKKKSKVPDFSNNLTGIMERRNNSHSKLEEEKIEIQDFE